MHKDRIILAGGGTGGHVFPLIAVADELSRQAPHVELLFVGTERGIESQVVSERGYALELVKIEPIRGRGLVGGLRGVKRAAQSIPEAVRLVKRVKPKVIFSIGGYAAGSVSIAARLQSIPLALMEPNSVIGLTNRVVAPFVDRAYTAFGEVERFFPEGSVMRTGVAIRRGFEPAEPNFEQEVLKVLVLGGSQGARALNEVLPRALAAARTPLRVIHQSGKGNDEAIRSLYEEVGAGTQVEVVPFIADMPLALRMADLVIGRAGAGAVSEICAVGRPSLLVPYPHASGDHQYKNALSLVESGAAVCVRADEATVERLAHEVDALGSQTKLLSRMAAAAHSLGRPDAAEVVATDLLRLGNVTVEQDDEAQAADFDQSGGNGTPAPSEVH